MRILLVEDDPMIGKGLVQALRDDGHSVDWVRDGVAGEEAIVLRDHAMVLLDLGLPRKGGIELLRRTRELGIKVPILVITARDELEDRVTGLDNGADDYLVKPFETRELLARMRAVVRRQSGQADAVLRSGDVELNINSHELSYHGSTQQLSTKEFAVMQALLERPGQILSRSQLEDRIYGWGEEVESNAIDVLIYYIRRKFSKDIINNVRGAGWSIARGKA